jgi:hypothetical protein
MANFKINYQDAQEMSKGRTVMDFWTCELSPRFGLGIGKFSFLN